VYRRLDRTPQQAAEHIGVGLEVLPDQAMGVLPGLAIVVVPPADGEIARDDTVAIVFSHGCGPSAGVHPDPTSASLSPPGAGADGRR
jgi:hypothetical protein